MTINFAEAKKAVKRGERSANRALDTAHAASQRTVARARHVAEDMIEAGDNASQSTWKTAQSLHDWMEAKPHLAALAALAAGVVLGAILSPRR